MGLCLNVVCVSVGCCDCMVRLFDLGFLKLGIGACIVWLGGTFLVGVCLDSACLLGRCGF